MFAAMAAVGIAAPIASATGPIQASKTAEAHWTRTFEWTIDKSVSPASWDLRTGQSGTSTYTVAVTKSAGTDAYSVDGQVCVQNVGTEPTENLMIEDRLQALVGDDVITLASEPLDLSGNPVLDPGESQCYTYSIPFEPVAGATYRNNARITVTNDPRNPGEAMGPNEKVDFSLPAEPTTVNASVNVDDTNGMSWVFTDTGSVSYDRAFKCDGDAGTHSNTATIRETGQSDDASVTVTCTPAGRDCTYTQGYWKTHSKYGPAKKTDPTWALVGEDTPFFSSGKTWYEAITTPPKGGNVYYILAHQYIAAKLNLLAGTSSTPAVDGAIAWAEEFYNAHGPADDLSKAQRAKAVVVAAILALYNEGCIGPGHCKD